MTNTQQPNGDLVTAIAARNRILQFSQGCWRPLKKHAEETGAENSRHGLEDELKVKLTVTNHPSLVKLLNTQAGAYKLVDRITLPSCCKGMRLLPLGRLIELETQLGAVRTVQENLLAEFLNDWPGIRAAAPARLNGLFRAEMFPSSDMIRGQWRCEWAVLDCPTGGAWSQWLQLSAEAAQSELESRLLDAARHLITVCQGDGKLYSSVLENLGDICSLAGDLNLLDDPIISKAAQGLKPLTSVPAETLRENAALRRETAAQANKILSVLNLGGKKA